MDGYLARKGLQLIRNGYRIIPIPLGGKGPNLRNWLDIVATPEMHRKWISNGRAEDGVGILTGEIVGLDLDTPDGDMSLWSQDLAFALLGLAPVRIGQAPKRMLVYRTDAPFASFSSRAFEDLEGRKNQIDLIANRKQFVSDHTHPVTGKPYRWIRGEDLTKLLPADLTPVTLDEIREFIRLWEDECIRRGWKLLGSSTTPAAPSPSEMGGEPDDDDLDLEAEKRKPLADIDDDGLEKLVMSIPNGDHVPQTVDRDRNRLGWLEIVMAIHHQTGGSEFGRQLAHRWTQAYSRYDRSDLDKRWNSFGRDEDQRRRPMTARYIKKWAKIEREKADTRPTIHVRAGELHIMATEAERALIDQGAPLYTRGPLIVRPAIEEVPASKDRRTKVARLVTVSDNGMIDWFSRTAKWVRFDMKQKKDVPTNPPARVAGILASRDGEWRMNALAGVITTPTLRPDGSLLVEPGYDPATRLLLLQPPLMPDSRDFVAPLGRLPPPPPVQPTISRLDRSRGLSDLRLYGFNR